MSTSKNSRNSNSGGGGKKTKKAYKFKNKEKAKAQSKNNTQHPVKPKSAIKSLPQNQIQNQHYINNHINSEYATSNGSLPPSPYLQSSNGSLPPSPYLQSSKYHNLSQSKNNNRNNQNQNHTDYATTIGVDGKDYSKEKYVKAGQCYNGSYKVRGDPNSPYTGCNFIPKISPKLRGKICATSIKTRPPHTGHMKTYGFCKSMKNTKTPPPPPSPPPPPPPPSKNNSGELLDELGNVVPDVYADDKDLFGNPISDETKEKYGIVPGKCIFPFKYKSKKFPIVTTPRDRIYGEEFEGKDKMHTLNYYDCIPEKSRSKENKLGYWCPTSLKKNGMVDKKAYCNTYYKNPTKKVSAMPEVNSPKNTSVNSPKKTSAKKKQKPKANSTKKASAKETEPPLQQDPTYAVDYELKPGTFLKKMLNPKYMKSGKCIFPFKYKRKQHSSCTDSNDKPPRKICATEKKSKKSPTVTKFGICLPKGVTIEDQESSIKEGLNKLTMKKKKYPFKFVSKKGDMEKQEQEEIKLEEIRIDGKYYYIDQNKLLYHWDENEIIGIWDEETGTIID